MKIKKHTYLWKVFCDYLRTIQREIPSIEFVRGISEWMVENEDLFISRSWDDYGLEQLTKLDLKNYEVEFTDENVVSTIERLLKLNPSSEDSVAMILRDVLWDSIVFKTSKQCPNCGDDDLRALVLDDGGGLILSCDICTWSENEAGLEIANVDSLSIATRDDLIKFHRAINSSDESPLR